MSDQAVIQVEKMENFTPVSALAGGALIGIATSIMLWANGRITGISGIVGGVVFPIKGDISWRLVFLIGLLLGAFVYTTVSGTTAVVVSQSSPLMTVLAGLLVGFGTRMGSGCTSGHAICGIARISKRSFAATAIFMITAIVTVFVLRHLLGWQP